MKDGAMQPCHRDLSIFTFEKCSHFTYVQLLNFQFKKSIIGRITCQVSPTINKILFLLNTAPFEVIQVDSLKKAQI